MTMMLNMMMQLMTMMIMMMMTMTMMMMMMLKLTEVRLLFPRGFPPAPLSRRPTLSEELRVEV